MAFTTIEERIKTVREQGLSQLDLSDCGLMEIPQEVFTLKHLQTLILGKNYLPTDDQTNRNKITYIPLEISELIYLNGIGLAHNDLKEFPLFVTELPRLQTLMLNNNGIESLPPEISKLTKLRILGLDSNKITRLPAELGTLRELQVLGLAHNELSVLPTAILGLQQLQQLGLASNKFEIFPEELPKLRGLIALGLSNNNIKQIPEQITELARLQKMDLSGNPIAKPFIDAASKGARALQTWYYEIANRRTRRINQIVKGKREATERLDLRERFIKILKTKKLVCEVCNGHKRINGYSTQLKTHFTNDICYGCEGKGVPNETTEDLHGILENCHVKKERYRDELIAQVKEVNSFKQRMGSKTQNTSLLFEETRENIAKIIKEKEKQVDELTERFSVFELFETKVHILLYNHFLLKITKREQNEDILFSRVDKYGDFYSIANMSDVIISEIELLFDNIDSAFDEDEEKELRERLLELISEFEALGMSKEI